MKISIITATYNSSEFIKDCLQSVAGQTYKNVEHIIIDGGSTDATLSVIQQFKHVNKVISEKDNGIYDALNKGIQQATGDIIGFLHSDDFFVSEQVLEWIANIFTQNSTSVALYSDLIYVHRFNAAKILRTWKAGNYNRTLLSKGWMPPHPTFYVKRSVYINYGNFDTQFKIAADYDLMLRFLYRHQILPAYLPKTTVAMRSGGKSGGSVNDVFIKMNEDYKILKKNKTGGLYTLFLKNISKIPQFFKQKTFYH